MPPNNVNLGTARLVKAAILLALNSGYRPGRWGAIQALLSPTLDPIRQNFSPYSQGLDETAINWTIPAGRQIPCPTVVHNYKPAYALTAESERLRNANGAGLTAGVDQMVIYNFFKQKTFAITPAKELLEKNTEKYIDAILAGNIDLPNIPQNIQRGLKLLASEFLASLDSTFLKPTNAWALTAIAAAIGTNSYDLTAATPSATSPIIEIDTFDANGRPTEKLWEAINETRALNNFSGRPIVIGGRKALSYLNYKDIMALNDQGIDFAAMFGSMPIEFYFDQTIDSVLGAGTTIIMEPGAAFAETFCYHDFSQFVDQMNSDDTIDDTINVPFVRFKDDMAALQNGSRSFIRKFDLRTTRKRDGNDFTKLTFTPSIAAGVWSRPAGYFTNEANHPLLHNTGVYAFKLV